MDIVASYDAELGSMGRASFTLSGAYNKTTLRSFGTNPAPIAGLGQSVFDISQQSFLTDAAPKLKESAA